MNFRNLPMIKTKSRECRFQNHKSIKYTTHVDDIDIMILAKKLEFDIT